MNNSLKIQTRNVTLIKNLFVIFFVSILIFSAFLSFILQNLLLLIFIALPASFILPIIILIVSLVMPGKYIECKNNWVKMMKNKQMLMFIERGHIQQIRVKYLKSPKGFIDRYKIITDKHDELILYTTASFLTAFKIDKSKYDYLVNAEIELIHLIKEQNWFNISKNDLRLFQKFLKNNLDVTLPE